MKRCWLLLLCIIQFSCAGQRRMINGISFVGGPDEIAKQRTAPVANVNANWVCLMPFGFMRNIHSPKVRFNEPRQWWGERTEGVTSTAKYFHDQGIKVMIKPQIWVWHGEFTGTINMESEADWKAFETEYEKFILEFAQVARDTKAEMFCMGTELNKFVMARPAFWKKLIAKVRKVYPGKLTYAENWDTFEKVPFWEALDFVGVDAYFPLSKEKTPTIAEFKEGWQAHKAALKALSERTDKEILFTEYGYRSTSYAGKEPWNSDHNKRDVDLEAQSNGLAALFDEFWQENWFAGGFLWKWFDNHDNVGGLDDPFFTPQNKPAEQVVRQHYLSH